MNFLVFLLILNSHPLYFSVVSVELSEQVATRIEVRVFLDDLQNALKANHPAVELMPAEVFLNQYQENIEEYFQSHLLLATSSSTVELDLLSTEVVGDSYRIIFSGPPIQQRTIKIKADFLMGTFPDQENIVTIAFDGKKQYLRFRQDHKVQTLNL